MCETRFELDRFPFFFFCIGCGALCLKRLSNTNQKRCIVDASVVLSFSIYFRLAIFMCCAPVRSFFFFPITLARWKADPVGESVSLFPLDRLFFFFFFLAVVFILE